MPSRGSTPTVSVVAGVVRRGVTSGVTGALGRAATASGVTVSPRWTPATSVVTASGLTSSRARRAMVAATSNTCDGTCCNRTNARRVRSYLMYKLFSRPPTPPLVTPPTPPDSSLPPPVAPPIPPLVTPLTPPLVTPPTPVWFTPTAASHPSLHPSLPLVTPPTPAPWFTPTAASSPSLPPASSPSLPPASYPSHPRLIHPYRRQSPLPFRR